MQGTALRIAAVLALLLAPLLGVACTTSLEISVGEREDFSRYRTWNWLPGTARTIDAPAPSAAALDYDLARLVELEFERRGFERVHRGPDLVVGVLLNVRRQVVTIQETPAMEQLSSLHYSTNYQVQVATTRRQIYAHSRLAIFAIDTRRGRVVWKGTLEDRFRGEFSPYLEQTVASLLERFPSAGHASTERLTPAREPAIRLADRTAGLAPQ